MEKENSMLAKVGGLVDRTWRMEARTPKLRPMRANVGVRLATVPLRKELLIRTHPIEPSGDAKLDRFVRLLDDQIAKSR